MNVNHICSFNLHIKIQELHNYKLTEANLQKQSHTPYQGIFYLLCSYLKYKAYLGWHNKAMISY